MKILVMPLKAFFSQPAIHIFKCPISIVWGRQLSIDPSSEMEAGATVISHNSAYCIVLVIFMTCYSSSTTISVWLTGS